MHGTPPGQGWAYNDVRMNLLAYALTLLFRRPLPDVLRERVIDPLGAPTGGRGTGTGRASSTSTAAGSRWSPAARTGAAD